MAVRTVNQNLNTAPIALNANRTSNFMPLKNILLYSITAIITGVPTGTLTLQACNDPETNDTTPDKSALKPVNWVTIEDSDFTVTTAGNNMWNVREIGYNYVRVVYVDASGGVSTATMQVIFNGKGL